MFDENWQFLISKSFFKVAYMATIKNELYLTGDSAVYKTDRNLNVLQTFTYTGAGYRGIYYDTTSDTFYVAAYKLNKIHILDRNLTLIDSIDVNPYVPYSISENEGRFYVGNIDSTGDVLVIENKLIIYTFKGCNGQSSYIYSMLIDADGYMFTVCRTLNTIYLNHINGTYMGKSIATQSNPSCIYLDTKGRYIFNSFQHIDIYH